MVLVHIRKPVLLNGLTMPSVLDGFIRDNEHAKCNTTQMLHTFRQLHPLQSHQFFNKVQADVLEYQRGWPKDWWPHWYMCKRRWWVLQSELTVSGYKTLSEVKRTVAPNCGD